MDNDFDISAEQHARDVKARLVVEVGKTDLGKYLLDYLAARNIDIVISSDLSKGNTEDGTAAAYWDPKANAIIIDPNANMATLMHFFAHETRHVAQGEVNRKLGYQIEKLHPYNAILHMRAQELDADVFAVYFMANHALKAKYDGDKPDYFTELSQPAPPPKVIERGNQEIIFRYIDRSGMYRKFVENWLENEKPQDLTKPLQRAAGDFVDNEQITKFYAKFAMHSWSEGILPLLHKYKDDPESPFATAFRDAAQSRKDKKWPKPEEIVKNTMQAYGKIFADAGAPDYTTGVNFEKFLPYFLDESPGATSMWTDQRFEEQSETFRKAADYYLEKAPLPAKPAAKTSSRARK